ncbi:FKBP-type peptidyl-prolyl cis-trans isomerase [Rugosimonospora acidiphila]|uniref:FKBP-type peptidyl-prolyl cis-trans isomerase n=1 Tax=Rugosimonospora acidiphila TaxID=556531 RepID=UPI0031EBBBFA
MSDRARRDAVKLVRSANKEADARRRRMQSLAGGLAGVVVMALIVIGYVVLGGSNNSNGSADASAQAGAAATAGANDQGAADGSTDPAGAAGTPSLPPGANPALAKEPTVSAGTGDVTKLVVTTLIQGTGDAVKSGQNITVNYVGVTYKDGQEFDASWDHGQTATFQIGVGAVIPGWDQGLVGVKVGSRVQLDIPASLAYGDTPPAGAPTGALRFVVDVLAAQ